MLCTDHAQTTPLMTKHIERSHGGWDTIAYWDAVAIFMIGNFGFFCNDPWFDLLLSECITFKQYILLNILHYDMFLLSLHTFMEEIGILWAVEEHLIRRRRVIQLHWHHPRVTLNTLVWHSLVGGPHWEVRSSVNSWWWWWWLLSEHPFSFTHTYHWFPIYTLGRIGNDFIWTDQYYVNWTL